MNSVVSKNVDDANGKSNEKVKITKITKCLNRYKGTLFSLVFDYDFDDVWPRFIQLYKVNKKNVTGYGMAYDELSDIVSIIINNDEKLKKSDVTLTFHHVINDTLYVRSKSKKKDVFVPYFLVDGFGEPDENGICYYGVSMLTRKEWLMMPYNRQALTCSVDPLEDGKDDAVLTDIDMICHCLWEMTFFGFTEAVVKKQTDAIVNDVDDVKETSKISNKTALKKRAKK